MFTNDSKPLPRIGYGAMVLEGFYGASDDDAAVETLRYAIDHNLMLDTADFYGAGFLTGNLQRLEAIKNFAALDITLAGDTLRRLDELAPVGAFQGGALI